MKKEQGPLSDTSVPDSLNIFARKIGQKICIRETKNKVTAKELLRILMPNHNQLGCLPLITTSERCSHEMDDIVKKTFEDCNKENIEVEKSLKKVFRDSEEKMAEEESETCSCTSLTDESELSFDGKWLKKFFKVPLKMAIKEIISKKPYDPVHYLGFWLLNYRRCEEHKHWQLEMDNELNHLRSLVEEPISKREEVSVDIGEEEEEGMLDWNFKHYESIRVSK